MFHIQKIGMKRPSDGYDGFQMMGNSLNVSSLLSICMELCFHVPACPHG
jgi:hypothetical protein